MNLDLPELPEPNIVPMNEDAAAHLEIRKKAAQGNKYCPSHHRRVYVDSHRRMLECQDCGKIIDPFDYVSDWANQAEHRMTGLKTAEAQERVARVQVRELSKRIDNIRAQLKRAGAPQPEVERMAYKHELLNAVNETSIRALP